MRNNTEPIAVIFYLKNPRLHFTNHGRECADFISKPLLPAFLESHLGPERSLARELEKKVKQYYVAPVFNEYCNMTTIAHNNACNTCMYICLGVLMI